MEINFDGLIGSTHNYSGLAFGNIPSMEHKNLISNPKQAALQGLEKMYTLAKLGLKQAVLPPQERPCIPVLRALGFHGKDAEILQLVKAHHPYLLHACSSASSMWVANAATMTPSADANDGRAHFTIANLITDFHRSIEPPFTAQIFHRIFNHPVHFIHHFLPVHSHFGDEGAANHTRFCKEWNKPGVHLFVYGRSIHSKLHPKHFPARQTKEAAQAIARHHRLDSESAIFAQQNPEAIDQGVFHNDVISVGNQNLFFYHEKAFIDTPDVIAHCRQQFEKLCHSSLITIEVKSSELSLEEAVKTYLFNSQIVTLSDQTMVLIAPEECQKSEAARGVIERLIQNTQQPIRNVIYQDLRQSMQNGGGPACLRLRVVLNKNEYAAMHPHLLLTDALYAELVNWIHDHYRDRLSPDDLADPQLLEEGRRALDELTSILQLGPIYPFQRLGPPPFPESR